MSWDSCACWFICCSIFLSIILRCERGEPRRMSGPEAQAVALRGPLRGRLRVTERGHCNPSGSDDENLNHLARIQDSLRIEQALEALHQIERHGILHHWQEIALHHAD